MHLLSERDVSKILRTMNTEQGQQFLKALTDSLSTYTAEQSTADSERLLHQPLRSHITTKDKNTTLIMPSSDTTNVGVKMVTLPAWGTPVGVINIFDASGRLIGLVDASEVTAFRTALAAISVFLLCDHIKRKNIVVFGGGRQVEWHIRLALLLLPPGEIESFTVINRSRKRLDDLDKNVISQLRESYPGVSYELIAKEDAPEYDSVLKAAVGQSDAIFGCTPSTEPLFPYPYLQPEKQRVISLIGSYKPNMKEIDTETLLSGGGKVFVDTKKACLEESGELIDAKMAEGDLIEIGELFNTSHRPDLSKYPNVIFKCVGMGIMDLVMGRTLLEVASQTGLGTTMDW
jgi:ornithine cyclodeaminase/alanine dehydrogenase-like protein (mu-crystallin family)